MIVESTITCPNCGTAKSETMPTDACQFFYDCSSCAELLKPKSGDCCVFCSYGSVPCPPIQAGETPTCRPRGDPKPSACSHSAGAVTGPEGAMRSTSNDASRQANPLIRNASR